MHLGDTREQVPADNVDERARFYFGMLNVAFEGAVAGIMQEFGCDRPTAERKLMEARGDDPLGETDLPCWVTH